MNIQFNKLYYKYIKSSDINHFRLLILTEEFQNIGKNYFNKYPSAQCWINLNKQAEIEYNNISKKQKEIKDEFFKNHEIICKESKNKEYIIFSDYFQKFYVEKKYHYEQYTDLIIKNIITDINNNI